MTTSEVEAVLGKPDWVGTTSEGEPERRWPQLTVRWDRDSQRVVEIAIPTDRSVTVAGAPLLPSADPVGVLLNLDPEPVVCLGYLLFRGIGVAVTGFHDGDTDQESVTVFGPGRWDGFAAHFEAFARPDAARP